MKVEKNKMVTVTYELRLGGKNGNVVEVSGKNEPLQFAYGVGMLLPAFENGLTDKEIDDNFEIEISAKDGYGERVEDMLVSVPKDIFEIDGKLDYEMISVGNALPMMSNNGDQLTGVVKSVDEHTVTMDFNHPLAGEDLYFLGKVVDIREATEDELLNQYGDFECCGGGGCSGCGDDCDDDCCDDEK